MSNSIQLNEFIESEDAIFHYTRASVAIENILFDGKFRLSLLEDSNDPIEYKYKLLHMHGHGKQLPQEEAVDLYEKAHPVFDRIIRKETRVMCFCSNTIPTIILNNGETAPDKWTNTIGWRKPRMWAQYGDDHRGICLVFSRKALEAEFADKKGSVIAKNMQYTKDTFIKYNTLNGNQLVEDGVEVYCYNHIKQHSDAIFFTKNIDYRDENEYRVVVFDLKNEYEFINISKSVKGVIAGDRTPKVYFSLIMQLSKRYGIECRRAYWERGRGTLQLILCKGD